MRREMEILGLIAKGLSNSQVALRLNLSQETIKWYNKRIFLKLGVGSRTQAIAKAGESGLLETQPDTQTSPGVPTAAQFTRPDHLIRRP